MSVALVTAGNHTEPVVWAMLVSKGCAAQRSHDNLGN